MTHALELPEEVERVLEVKARLRGLGLEDYLLDLATRDAQNDAPSSQESAAQKEAARREAVRAGFGKFAHCGETPEERRRAKEEEMRREAAL